MSTILEMDTTGHWQSGWLLRRLIYFVSENGAALFSRLDPPTKLVVQSAISVGIDLPQFHACLNGGKYEDKVTAEAKDADALEIHATPTFVIGRGSNGELTATLLVGALDHARFQIEIDNLLRDQNEILANRERPTK